MTIPWYVYAFSASLIWGVHYVLLGRALTTISPISLYWLPTIPLTLFLPFYYKTLIQDYHNLLQATNDVKISAGIVMFTSVIASLLLYKAIHSSNASLASLIEITYPVFVVIFAMVIFGENHLSSTVMVGGSLIMLGTGIVIYGS